MKKVIRGRFYNTETAVKVGETSGGGETPSDFHYWEEVLYKKRTGEYFLHCYGGALSKYGVWRGNSGTSGELIKPLPYSAAAEWAERALDGDDYIAEFGDPERSDDKCKVTYSIKQENAEKAKKLAAMQDIAVSELIDRLIANA